MYGSMSTGLAYEESDLDLAICGLQHLMKDELVKYIQEFSKALLNYSWASSCQAIVTARVPVVKFVCLSKLKSYRKLT